MTNKKENKVSNFVKGEVLKLERNSFTFRIFAIVVSYAAMTLWLNAIRTTAPLWFVWVLIIIQLLLYCSIFLSCCARLVVIGLNKNIGLAIFITLAVLGRVNDWELLIIPLTVIVILIYSAKAKNVSNEHKAFLRQKSDITENKETARDYIKSKKGKTHYLIEKNGKREGKWI